MSATTSTARPSPETGEQEGGIVLIDTQTNAAPLEAVPFARAQIFNEFDASARAPHCQRNSHILKRHASPLRPEYRPREEQADKLFREIIEIADDASGDYVKR